jgi:hypothetical protein
MANNMTQYGIISNQNHAPEVHVMPPNNLQLAIPGPNGIIQLPIGVTLPAAIPPPQGPPALGVGQQYHFGVTQQFFNLPPV